MALARQDGLAPNQVFYCGRKAGSRWLPDPPARFEHERRPDKYFTSTDGKFIGCALRWEAHLQVIDHKYAPMSPEKLAEARATRERKDILKKADDMPLFREAVIAGIFPFNKKPRKRR